MLANGVFGASQRSRAIAAGLPTAILLSPSVLSPAIHCPPYRLESSDYPSRGRLRELVVNRRGWRDVSLEKPLHMTIATATLPIKQPADPSQQSLPLIARQYGTPDNSTVCVIRIFLLLLLIRISFTQLTTTSRPRQTLSTRQTSPAVTKLHKIPQTSTADRSDDAPPMAMRR